MTSSPRHRSHLALFWAAACACLMTGLAAAEPAKYHLTFDDEFGAGFQADRWRSTDYHGIRNNSGDFQAQWFWDTDTCPPHM